MLNMNDITVGAIAAGIAFVPIFILLEAKKQR